MSLSPFITVVAIALAASLAACDRSKMNQPETSKTESTATSDFPAEQDRQAFIRSAEKEMEDLRGAISDLKAKAAAANEQAKVRLQAEAEDLEVEWRATKDRLSTLQTATAQSWKQLNDAFANSLRHLKDAIETSRKKAG